MNAFIKDLLSSPHRKLIRNSDRLTEADRQRFGARGQAASLGGQLATAVEGQSDVVLVAPMALFCRKHSYRKVFDLLHQQFCFQSGELFKSMNKRTVVALFFFNPTKVAPIRLKHYGSTDVTFTVQKYRLLKNCWKVDQRKGTGDTLLAPHRGAFLDNQPSLLHLNPKFGGSEMVSTNVVESANVSIGGRHIRSELVYGLWSVLVGCRSTAPAKCPWYFKDAYVHIPKDFDSTSVEMLGLTIVFLLLENCLCHRIFIACSEAGVVNFGHLSDDANILIEQIRHLDVDRGTSRRSIQSLLCWLGELYRVGDNLDCLYKERVQDWRREIVKEIHTRVHAIGYYSDIFVSM